MIKETLLASGGRARAMLGGFTTGQKAVTVLGVVMLLVGGILFMSWSGKPAYTPLFSNLSGNDAAAIVAQLDTAGVPYTLTDGGASIMVPQDKVYDTRLKMSAQGLPGGSQEGYALLDKQGITTSDFMQHVGYQRALEGELARTIMAMDGVQGAVVHLALPEKNVFLDEQAKATASVLISLRQGAVLATGQVTAVSNLVASSVPGLDPSAVTIADGAGRVLSGGDGTTLDGAAATRQQATQAFENRLSLSAQSMLDQLTGAGHAVVQVSANLDFDQTESKTQTYVADPKAPPLRDTTSKETYTGTGDTGGGILGPGNPANGGTGTGTGAANGTGTGNSTYSKEMTSADNSVGSVVENRKAAPGAVKRLSVAVLLDARTAGTLDPTKVTQLVTNAVGLDAKRGDTIQVESLPFNNTADTAAEQAAADAAAAESKTAMFGMIKQAGIVILVLAVLILAFLNSRRQRRTDLLLNPQEELETGRLQAIRAEADAQVLAAAGDVRAELAAADSDAARRAAVREDIGELVQRQPDEVAQLLRGWLADRRR